MFYVLFLFFKMWFFRNSSAFKEFPDWPTGLSISSCPVFFRRGTSPWQTWWSPRRRNRKRPGGRAAGESSPKFSLQSSRGFCWMMLDVTLPGRSRGAWRKGDRCPKDHGPKDQGDGGVPHQRHHHERHLERNGTKSFVFGGCSEGTCSVALDNGIEMILLKPFYNYNTIIIIIYYQSICCCCCYCCCCWLVFCFPMVWSCFTEKLRCDHVHVAHQLRDSTLQDDSAWGHAVFWRQPAVHAPERWRHSAPLGGSQGQRGLEVRTRSGGNKWIT